ncbi:peptidoglycan DD-metalloendopeptidase family protein [Nostoc sp. FACHB-110]|uniref:peptidoglycan DD-metalloendopeptidase family protein n=1 Tax=Nostoc sp. FACHB-110 TaxID=2692834 RepID=UPI0016846AAE|nr:peptidoglycan DD-metalloendopeptidase family protein [Nostoc sp. FACHB-110]MBD2440696.1 peptidoglycan DD-metalloendopeptidase family protein [Nostoc sp. FACHB-110]
MTQRNTSAHNPDQNSKQQGLAKKRFVSTLPAQSLCLLSSVSLLSGGFVFAQTDTSIDNIVPVENSQPTGRTNYIKKDIVIPEAPKAQPEFSQRRANLTQRLRKPQVAQSQEPLRQSQPQTETAVEPVFTPRRSSAETLPKKPVSVRTAKPKLEVSQPTASVREEPKIEVAKPVVPRVTPEKLPEVAQPANNHTSVGAVNGGSTTDYNNAYIDPNDYGTSTTNTYKAPDSVILTNRTSGCRTILPSGQVISTSFCEQSQPTSNQRVANSESKSAPNWLKKSQNTQLANVQPIRPLASTSNETNWRAPRVVSGGEVKTAFRPNRFIPSPSEFVTTKVSATPVAPSAGTLPPPMIEGNLAPRPGIVAYDIPLASVLPQIPFSGAIAYSGSTSGIMYPLAVPAPITSLFGWRIHPITGNRRFHAGTDLGAPMGTPILAAAKGQVETAGWVGGYGLTVILNHSSTQQTLYGHMSEIFVQPGQIVEPGMMIGRVGSTGNSTGPHLHFEARRLTQDGWVAVDPNGELQAGLNQLLNPLRTAQVP